jgi:hypothetical protein
MKTIIEKFSSRHMQREKLPGLSRKVGPTRRCPTKGPARLGGQNTKSEEKANRYRAQLEIP